MIEHKILMARRPRIGITMRLELETRRFYLGRDYSEAIEACGGVPVHLSLIPKPEYIVECSLNQSFTGTFQGRAERLAAFEEN